MYSLEEREGGRLDAGGVDEARRQTGTEQGAEVVLHNTKCSGASRFEPNEGPHLGKATDDDVGPAHQRGEWRGDSLPQHARAQRHVGPQGVRLQKKCINLTHRHRCIRM